MHSIRGRLLLLAAIWISAALLAAFLFISSLLEDFVTDRFDIEAASIADALTAALEADDDGRVELDKTPFDPRFSLPFSGWYWQISADGAIIARSQSLLDQILRGPEGSFIGGHGIGSDQSSLRVLRRELTIPDSDAQIAVIVTAPGAEINESLQEISRPLGMSLVVLGVGLALASLMQISLGLQSLNHLRDDLARVRAGKTERLRRPEVSELRPLTAEINASLDQNATLLARSRQHLGNLAHSLKTPLAALTNELPSDHTGQKLITRMDRLIGWHLRRARSSGPRTLGQYTPIRPVMDDILLVLRWPMQERGITAQIDCPETTNFPGEKQDLEEMIGNLSENAVKYAASHVRLSASQATDCLTIKIEDDGPGMAETDRSRALIRGARLDEHGPAGFGLGLAIVADLAALHGGELRLERSNLGGLAAILAFPE